jgi:hypothetical protein
MSGGVCSILWSSTEAVELRPGPMPGTIQCRHSAIMHLRCKKRNVGHGAVTSETHFAAQRVPTMNLTSKVDRAESMNSSGRKSAP